jgi:hypothetical protein
VYIEVDSTEQIPKKHSVAVRQGWDVGNVDGRSRLTSQQLVQVHQLPYCVLERQGDCPGILLKYDLGDQEFVIGFFM